MTFPSTVPRVLIINVVSERIVFHPSFSTIISQSPANLLRGITLQQPSPPPSAFGIPIHNCPKEKPIPRALRHHPTVSRSRSGALWWVRVKAVHRTLFVMKAMSQRILIRPSQLLITPRLFCQRTVPAFTYHKLQSSTQHQTRTMSDIKQISSQRAAQRELDLMFWSLLLSLMVFS